MGMFDYLICEYPIDAPETVLEWQTKDTPEQYLENYKITKDGEIWHERREYSWEPDETKEGMQRLAGALKTKKREWVHLSDFRGTIIFYGNERIDGKDDYKKWWEYSALFDDGKLISMKQIFPETPSTGQTA